MPEKHSRIIYGQRAFWLTKRLWELADGLEIFPVSINEIKEFDQNCWFAAENPPTCRAVAEHSKKIADADLSFPIILSSEGRLMDGGHRIAKAWLLGQEKIYAVQFEEDPAPDYFEPKGT